MRPVSFMMVFVFFVFLSLPALAFECPSLVMEGRSLLAKAKLSAADSSRAKALLAEAEKLHSAGSHGESVEKAKEALALLKNK
jgi:hypothetical protein